MKPIQTSTYVNMHFTPQSDRRTGGLFQWWWCCGGGGTLEETWHLLNSCLIGRTEQQSSNSREGLLPIFPSVV